MFFTAKLWLAFSVTWIPFVTFRDVSRLWSNHDVSINNVVEVRFISLQSIYGLVGLGFLGFGNDGEINRKGWKMLEKCKTMRQKSHTFEILFPVKETNVEHISFQKWKNSLVVNQRNKK